MELHMKIRPSIGSVRPTPSLFLDVTSHPRFHARNAWWSCGSGCSDSSLLMLVHLSMNKHNNTHFLKQCNLLLTYPTYPSFYDPTSHIPHHWKVLQSLKYIEFIKSFYRYYIVEHVIWGWVTNAKYLSVSRLQPLSASFAQWTWRQSSS